MKAPFPAERLPSLVRYDRETGLLYWLCRPRSMFANDRACSTWNARFAGMEAFTARNRGGYRFGTILGDVMLAHRVVWALVHGAWPSADIDHINGDRSDNRIGNLRQVSRQGNARNRAKLGKSETPRVGVNRKGDRWIARITVNYQRIYLGCFKSLEDAIACRSQAEIEHGFHKNHGRNPL